jgi:lantibiotic modifying enzyme
MSLDDLVAPAVAYEISMARAEHKLEGDSSGAQYVSYFVRGGAFTEQLTGFPRQYPFLFELIDCFLELELQAACTALRHLVDDWAQLRLSRVLSVADQQSEELPFLGIRTIEPTGSDGHAGHKKVLIFELEQYGKLVYKPFGGECAALYNEFVEALELPVPYNMQVGRSTI